LTAGQRLDALPDVLDRLQAELRELVAREAFHRGAIEHPQPAPEHSRS
jgi:hypothetical protein